MTRRSCRQANLWLAELQGGHLAEAEQIRLEEHLQTCAECVERAQGIGSIVTALKEQAALPSSERLARVFERIEAAQIQQRTPPLAKRPWRISLATVGLTLVIFGIVSGIYLWRERAHKVKEVALSPAITSLQAIAVSEVTLNGIMPLDAGMELRRGDRLNVGKHGQALLLSASEMFILKENTQISLGKQGTSGIDSLHLLQGALDAGTFSASHLSTKLPIFAGSLRLYPRGTIYSVEYRDQGAPPDVAVLEGRVEIRGSHKQVLLDKGYMLRWGERPRVLSEKRMRRMKKQLGCARRLARRGKSAQMGRLHLKAAPGDTIHVNGFALGPRASLFLPSGSYTLSTKGKENGPFRQVLVRKKQLTRLDLSETRTSPASNENHSGAVKNEPAQAPLDQGYRSSPVKEQAMAPKRSSKLMSRHRFHKRHASVLRFASMKKSLQAAPPSFRSKVLDIERLIASGYGRESRQKIRHLVSQKPKQQLLSLLNILLAESFLVESQYAQATQAYLKAWKNIPRSQLAADALYMAGSLELEPLKNYQEAQKIFQRYLEIFSSGSLREEAFLMLLRAQHQSRELHQAQNTARRYLNEYPHGHFVKQAQSVIDTKELPAP